MKIVIINGSLRKNGATAYILHKIEEILLSKGAEVLFYDLIEQNMSYCTGCCFCYKKGHCIKNDDAEYISNQIVTADAVVLGSSTIASNVSSVMKAFIDRGHFVVELLLYKKYSMCVTTYENYGGKHALKVLKNLVKLSGSFLSGCIAEKTPFNYDLSKNRKLNNIIIKKTNRLFNDILHKKQYRLQGLKHKIIMNIGLKPFIKRKGNEYEAINKRWSDIGLM